MFVSLILVTKSHLSGTSIQPHLGGIPGEEHGRLFPGSPVLTIVNLDPLGAIFARQLPNLGSKPEPARKRVLQEYRDPLLDGMFKEIKSDEEESIALAELSVIFGR